MSITIKDLERIVSTLNAEVPNMDYSLECAYGGFKLTSHDRSKDTSTIGFSSKRDLYDWIVAYLEGIRLVTKGWN